MAKTIRIQKYLGDGGILSRRKTEEYIKAGRITVNGRPAAPGHPVAPGDVIAIDGQRVRVERDKENLYLMLNKPRGYVTTTSDELGRRCVTQLLEGVEARVYPVGRLDRDSEGLLLLTNDGQFANLIMHPSHHIGKTYRVTVRPGITEDQCVALAAGVDIGKDGEKEITAPATVLVLEKYPDRAVVQITIAQGKNRQVRRMCEAVGLTVARLKRTAIGPLRLGMLQPGEWRELKKSELIALRNAGGGTAAPPPPPPSPKSPRNQRPPSPSPPPGAAAPARAPGTGCAGTGPAGCGSPRTSPPSAAPDGEGTKDDPAAAGAAGPAAGLLPGEGAGPKWRHRLRRLAGGAAAGLVRHRGGGPLPRPGAGGGGRLPGRRPAPGGAVPPLPPGDQGVPVPPSPRLPAAKGIHHRRGRGAGAAVRPM